MLARKIPTAELAVELMERARTDGAELVGPGGFLAELTKRVLEAGLEAEITEHVGYEVHDPVGHHSGNSRNGSRSKTVITDIGPVEVEMPRDRTGTFEPIIVRKRQRRRATCSRTYPQARCAAHSPRTRAQRSVPVGRSMPARSARADLYAE